MFTAGSFLKQRIVSLSHLLVAKLAMEADDDAEDEDMALDDASRTVFFVEDGYTFTNLVQNALKKRDWQRFPQSKAALLKQKAQGAHGAYAKSLLRVSSFMWIRWRSAIPFKHMIPGRHIVNHISNEHIMTIKSKLCASMRGVVDSKGNAVHPQTFIHEDLLADDELARQVYAIPDTIWIMKPAMGSSGRGISIADDGAALEKCIEDFRADGTETMVIQTYIARPFTLRRHKFDIRVYLLIASVEPLVCFYHDGYLRVNAEPYDPSNTANSFAHITNFHVAVKHPDYDAVADRVGTMDVRWNFHDFEQYIDTLEGRTSGGVELLADMRVKMKDILAAVMNKMKGSLNPQQGCFALLGVDFLLDANERLWLLEFTKNPALRSNVPWLADLHTNVVQHIVDIALDISDRKANGDSNMDSVGEGTTFDRLACA